MGAAGALKGARIREPINRRDQKLDDLNWTNGGIDTVRGGAVREEDSIITAENGFRGITYLPPGTSPDGVHRDAGEGHKPGPAGLTHETGAAERVSAAPVSLCVIPGQKGIDAAYGSAS